MKSEQQPQVQISVVCPFYNEEKILHQAATTLLNKLQELDQTWELILVNDGSLDGSKKVIAEIAGREPRLKLVSYSTNRGRGHALRKGIERARGAVIVTTEIDLSWGDDIVQRLYREMTEHPECDIVVASPHLKGGGYKNVPLKRVFFSWFGNWVIRTCMTNAASMNTGMTRAYRREVIQSMPLEENGKEFHLEVIMKAQALRYRLHEMPCVLEWKEYKHSGKRVGRKSSSKVNRLVLSHTLFSIFANPIRYVWAFSGVAMLASLGFLAAGIVRLTMGLVSVYMLLISLVLAGISLVFFTFGVIAHQGNVIQKEVWTLKRQLMLGQREEREDGEAREPAESGYPSSRAEV